jgi:hypothetical protein
MVYFFCFLSSGSLLRLTDELKYFFRAFDCIAYSLIVGPELQQIERANKDLEEDNVQLSDAIVGPSHTDRTSASSLYALNPKEEAYSEHEVLDEVK